MRFAGGTRVGEEGEGSAVSTVRDDAAGSPRRARAGRSVAVDKLAAAAAARVMRAEPRVAVGVAEIAGVVARPRVGVAVRRVRTNGGERRGARVYLNITHNHVAKVLWSCRCEQNKDAYMRPGRRGKEGKKVGYNDCAASYLACGPGAWGQ